jgi:hypothetical protein
VTRRAAQALLPPLAAFVLARAFLVVISAGTSRPPWEPGSWSGPDTAHYLSIAKSGYVLVPCSPADPLPGRCGNAGWMPAYPWAIRSLIAAGLSPRRAAVMVSAVFAFLGLALLWNGFLASWGRDGVLPLLIAAFFPGQVYQHGAFPLAQFTFFALLSLHLAGRGRWWGAGLAGAAAALTYPTGCLLAPVLFTARLLSGPDERSRRQAAGAATLVLAGFAGILALQWWKVGVWNAFFVVQGGYGHRLGNPLPVFWGAVREAFTPPWQGVGEGPALQTLFVAGWVVVTLALAARRRERRDVLVVTYALAFWLFPLCMGGTVSLYRAEATLLPTTLLARGMPRPVACLALGGAVVVAWSMGVLYFRLLLV